MDDTEGNDPTRRRLLQGSAVLAAGLAGCIGDGDGDGDDGAGSDGGDGTGGDGAGDGGDDTSDTDDNTSDGDDGARTPTETPTPSPTPDDPPEDIETEPLPERGDEEYLADVEQFESQGANHVQSGTDIDYDTMPPTSGPHYSSPAGAGFYTEDDAPDMGNLVHSIEHGAVVIYYDPDQITDDARESLEAFASEHTGAWASFLAVPHPEDDPDHPYVLTAWRHMLRMDEYDPRVVHAFLAEYVGRGPEYNDRD